MNSEPGKKNVATGKAVSIAALYVLSVLIILAGAVFSVRSLLTGFSFSVFSSQIPGVAFGLVGSFPGDKVLLLGKQTESGGLSL